ncbi:MAG TPA: 6,7-dimethyl-8-ribityllumazine synthase [Usitatibacteraceae bacterium]|nr:6,7-dimethyl-8-ribityllumazine synthase [Usitatibacteraceae bacterium]
MRTYPLNTRGAGLSIGIAHSRFNEPVVKALLEACVATLIKHGVDEERIEVVAVPGALEIPLALQALAASGRFDALIALGAVIRGETYHFEVVSNESCRGVMDVMLDTGLPVANGILTVDTDEQAAARTVEKGGDCARVAIEMARTIAALAQRREP